MKFSKNKMIFTILLVLIIIFLYFNTGLSSVKRGNGKWRTTQQTSIGKNIGLSLIFIFGFALILKFVK